MNAAIFDMDYRFTFDRLIGFYMKRQSSAWKRLAPFV
jgi:hypothetical protein